MQNLPIDCWPHVHLPQTEGNDHLTSLGLMYGQYILYFKSLLAYNYKWQKGKIIFPKANIVEKKCFLDQELNFNPLAFIQANYHIWLKYPLF